MATRAAIAAAERKSKEKIAYEDRKSREREGEANRTKDVIVSTQQAAATVGKEIAKGSFIAAANHPEWYKKLLPTEYRADLPTYSRVGLPLNPKWLTDFNLSLADHSDQNVVAGICVIEWVPSLPNQKTGNAYYQSPINDGLARFMSNLRKYNSRVGEYDAGDIGLYWYAAADYLSLIEDARWCINIYNTYHATNAYFAKDLIRAKGFDADDFFANITMYKALVSKHIALFNTNIVVPKNLTFFQRRLWLSRLLIADHKSKKCQLYITKQCARGYLNSDEDMVNISMIQADYTYQSYESDITTFSVSLVNSVGIQVMMQDLRAGIPETEFLKLELLEGKATKDIFYIDQDLEQIHNLITMPGRSIRNASSYSALSIGGLAIHMMADGYLYQGTLGAGGVVSRPGPYCQVNGVFSPSGFTIANLNDVNDGLKNEFLNFYHDDVNQDSILEATRLRQSGSITLGSDNNYYYYPDIRGTEVVLCMHLYTRTDTGLYVPGELSTRLIFSHCRVAFTDAALVSAINTYSRFDWAPKIKFYYENNPASGQVVLQYNTFGEIDNYFPINPTELKNIHEVCALSLFYLQDSEFKGNRYR